MRYQILRGAYEAAWLLVVAMFVTGWAFAFTTVGAVLIVSGTVGCVLLFVASRTPGALIAFTIVMSLGWYGAFVVAPWLVVLPAALLVIAWRWRQQRATAR